MQDITVKPENKNLKLVENLIDEVLKNRKYDPKARTRLSVILDEIYGNIVKYSKASYINVSAGVSSSDKLTVIFTDDGKAFNPLEIPNPDIDRSIDNRPLGGLGMLIVKESTDDAFYNNTDGKNILTIKKKI